MLSYTSCTNYLPPGTQYCCMMMKISMSAQSVSICIMCIYACQYDSEWCASSDRSLWILIVIWQSYLGTYCLQYMYVLCFSTSYALLNIASCFPLQTIAFQYHNTGMSNIEIFHIHVLYIYYNSPSIWLQFSWVMLHNYTLLYCCQAYLRHHLIWFVSCNWITLMLKFRQNNK